MSFIESMFGGSSGFSANNGPSLLRPATVAQANEQYGNVQTGLSNQAAFLQAVQAQNGLQNQSNVFNQQQQLANTLSQQAAGAGPNPALAQLNQQTANNTANQAALMAGQRGTGANAGLIARQAANVGASNQQAAVGQQATLQAQQQLAAQQQLQQQQNAMQSVAGNQIGTQANATNAYSNSAQNALGQVYGQINAQNNASIGQTSAQNSANFAQHNLDNQTGGAFLSGIAPALGPIGQSFSGMGKSGAPAGGANPMAGGAMDAGSMAPLEMMAAHGGQVPAYADGGAVHKPHVYTEAERAPNRDDSHVNVPRAEPSRLQTRPTAAEEEQMPVWDRIVHGVTSSYAQGGEAGPRSFAGKHLKGAHNMKAGGHVPGKAAVSGDSYSNDTVKAVLSPGEIVIPRHITQGPDAANKAAKFVAAILAKKGGLQK